MNPKTFIIYVKCNSDCEIWKLVQARSPKDMIITKVASSFSSNISPKSHNCVIPKVCCYERNGKDIETSQEWC